MGWERKGEERREEVQIKNKLRQGMREKEERGGWTGHMDVGRN